jgi:hypothetical protein
MFYLPLNSVTQAGRKVKNPRVAFGGRTIFQSGSIVRVALSHWRVVLPARQVKS